MIGPIEQMAYWQQMVIGGGLFAVLVWLQLLPGKTQQTQKLPREENRRDDCVGRR